ncbi:glutamate-5-semialdehyde dehydrogenase [Alkalicoccus halolimnae]|uniref:Gamma-glutamyl phosphate reductase n=1 Tax=Alkalicoccus halolimnae TaxID=1667239 RepID=A0A5C7FR86_9BACI|nr:glutamate-5-semialdehyde dehydrogenase [Alkalicoccus halolimnae]TXF87225.1 glutamate-5-semialdehyde dehydrogenase [Alkalicoccus halolimnae]
MNEVRKKAKEARQLSHRLPVLSKENRKQALLQIADMLDDQITYILEENQKDVALAKENNVESSLIDRLTLNEERLSAITDAVRAIADLPDDLGKTIWEDTRPNRLHIKQVQVPIGVIGVIYEARPNVTVDISALAVKTGNAVILRGSSSTIYSNKAITAIMQKALSQADYPAKSIQLIENTDRSLTKEMFTARGLIDVIIPRGGKSLIDTVVKESEVPVIETGAGNCHIYIDRSADSKLARKIAVDAKVQRPSVCNSCETLVIDKTWAAEHLTDLVNDLHSYNVKLYGDKKSVMLDSRIHPASESDWEKEYLSLEAAVKITENPEEAVEHIQHYSTKHSESVISEDASVVELFFNEVDASTLYHNASTRFTDGFEFGFGAEVGISTQKLHARGAMGLSALMTTKYLVSGQGQTKGQLPLSAENQE